PPSAQVNSDHVGMLAQCLQVGNQLLLASLRISTSKAGPERTKGRAAECTKGRAGHYADCDSLSLRNALRILELIGIRLKQAKTLGLGILSQISEELALIHARCDGVTNRATIMPVLARSISTSSPAEYVAGFCALLTPRCWSGRIRRRA